MRKIFQFDIKASASHHNGHYGESATSTSCMLRKSPKSPLLDKNSLVYMQLTTELLLEPTSDCVDMSVVLSGGGIKNVFNAFPKILFLGSSISICSNNAQKSLK